MPDFNPDTLPTRNDLTGPCPWCGRSSNFKLAGPTIELMWKQVPWEPGGGTIQVAGESATVIECMGCNRRIVVVTDHQDTGIHWYPAPGAGMLDPDVPAEIASAFDEGMRCLGIGANRAAAVMFRSALHLFVKNKGDEQAKAERHLKTALKHMKDSGSLHPSLWNWADHLNQLGNEGAHPEDYDDVTAEEADGLGKFVRHLIKNEYEMPAELLRAQGFSSSQPNAGDPPG